MASKKCIVLLTDSIDFKNFRRLMDKHDIEILDETNSEEGTLFYLNAKEETVEPIMVESRMEWKFA